MFLASPLYASRRYEFIPPTSVQKLLNLNLDSDLTNHFTAIGKEENRFDTLRNITSDLSNCIKYFESVNVEKCPSAELSKHYSLCIKIIRGAKINILKHKVLENYIITNELLYDIERFERVISKIFIAYEKVDFNSSSSSLPLHGNGSELLKVFPQLMLGKISNVTLLPPETFEEYFCCFKLDLEKMRAKIFFEKGLETRALEKKFQKIRLEESNWRLHLKEVLSCPLTRIELTQLARLLHPIQALEVITICLGNDELSEKCLCLLTTLNYEVFQELMLSLSQDEKTLTYLNSQFQKILLVNKELQKWIEGHFFIHRQTFVDTLNNVTGSVDMLSRRFREHMYTYSIMEEDLKDIDHVRENATLHYVIIQTLQKLYSHLLKDPETLNVLKEVEEAYQDNILRVTQDDKHPHPKGHIFDIIARNAFESHGLENNDPAIECFAPWYLISPEALYASGLLDNYDEGELKGKNLREINVLARDRLHEIGILSVGDANRMRIYNVNLLKKHLDSLSKGEKG